MIVSMAEICSKKNSNVHRQAQFIQFTLEERKPFGDIENLSIHLDM